MDRELDGVVEEEVEIQVDLRRDRIVEAGKASPPDRAVLDEGHKPDGAPLAPRDHDAQVLPDMFAQPRVVGQRLPKHRPAPVFVSPLQLQPGQFGVEHLRPVQVHAHPSVPAHRHLVADRPAAPGGEAGEVVREPGPHDGQAAVSANHHPRVPALAQQLIEGVVNAFEQVDPADRTRTGLPSLPFGLGDRGCQHRPPVLTGEAGSVADPAHAPRCGEHQCPI